MQRLIGAAVCPRRRNAGIGIGSVTGSPSERLTALALVVVALPVGLLLRRFVARRMGDYRRARLADVNRILSALATTAGGAFEPGTTLAHHPLLGELCRYGTAHVAAGRLAIEVGVSYPAGDVDGDRTTVRIVPPPDRRWRVTRLRLRRPCAPANDPRAVDGEVARCFEISGPAELPPAARTALVRVGARAASLDLRDGTLELVAAPDGETTYVSPVARLHTLVEQVAEAAEALLLPSGG